MPDSRTHRGPHPNDDQLFAQAAIPALRNATDDLCWLLSREYAARSAVKIVGDRYALLARQRIAVARCACSDEARTGRGSRQIDSSQLQGSELWIDGYNVLTTVEAALAGGAVLHARDECFRDMASMHGSYRKVAETIPAIELIGRVTGESGVQRCRWLLDRPVSNSGRLKAILLDVARRAGWDWSVQLVQNPDHDLAESDQLVATADSAILDRCSRWFNLARGVVAQIPSAWIVDLAKSGSR